MAGDRKGATIITLSRSPKSSVLLHHLILHVFLTALPSPFGLGVFEEDDGRVLTDKVSSRLLPSEGGAIMSSTL